MRSAWLAELLLLVFWLCLALLAHLVGDLWLNISLGWWVALALTLVSFRHIRQMQRLDRWLNSGRSTHPPDSWGVWGEVFDQYYRLQRRYNKRKKRLARVIREFRESTAAMPDGTIVLDSEMRISWFNNAAIRLLDLAGNRDIGQLITNLLRAPRFDQYMRAADFSRSIEMDSPTRIGDRLAVRAVPYGRGQYLLLLRDITRVQRLQNMRRDFVANASHELRSPLTVLGGYLENLSEDDQIPAIWNGPLDEMQVQCHRMTTLINDLLELSRLETDEPAPPEDQPVQVPGLIRRIKKEADAQPARARTIELVLDESLGLAGVENELYSAFSNLVFNAIRYTEPDGHIQVRWEAEFSDDEVTGARFTVADHGIGIDRKHVPYLTQRFYRVDAARSRGQGGTGLGLAIVKHVLQRHDAALTIESELGVGSTFSCLFKLERVRWLSDEDAVDRSTAKPDAA
ncbi:MAG: phosphate regulon sensor histidine kinase PhoR [Pseudomonadota bacterium]